MKKIFVSIIIALTMSLIFCLPSAFANNMINDAANGVRNVVGGAENAVENTAKGATGAIRSGINTVGNSAENTMNTVKTDVNNATKNASNTAGYTTTRTTAETTNGNFFKNMGNNVWTWIVVGIIALAIIGIIWYYMARQGNYNNRNDE